MKIIHLSDLHFHRDNNDNREIIETLNKVNIKYPKHYVVITGDITDDGHEIQYENAYEHLKQFMGRIFIVPGNHDFGAMGNFYSRERAKRFDEMLSIPLKQGGSYFEENKPVVNIIRDNGESVMFIGLDTNLETDHPFDFACGEIGDIQFGALSIILESQVTPEMTKVVFFHHHPFMHSDPFMELKDATRVARVLYNKADVILFGHKHEMAKWEKRWGARYILASDDSPAKNMAGEITIENGKISMDYISTN